MILDLFMSRRSCGFLAHPDIFSSDLLLWPPGASTLDPEMCGRYKLSVMVKDMAGKANAFFTTGIVTVEVTGNTWASPDPVRFQENFPGPYPIPISQVSHNPNYHPLSSLRDTSGCTFHIEVGSDPFVKHFPAITLQWSGQCRCWAGWSGVVLPGCCF